jgi:hypothetical protein
MSLVLGENTGNTSVDVLIRRIGFLDLGHGMVLRGR